MTWDALCQSIPDISALTVTRTADSPANHLKFGVPAVISTAQSAPARSVARTICSLATVAEGTSYYCPLDLNVSYQLAFTLPLGARERVDADPSGCDWATLEGAQGAPMRRTTPAFWSGLGAAVGLPGATERAFLGTQAN
jgi:hypothetical protein